MEGPEQLVTLDGAVEVSVEVANVLHSGKKNRCHPSLAYLIGTPNLLANMYCCSGTVGCTKEALGIGKYDP